MAQTVTKTFTQKFSFSGQYCAGNLSLVSETQSGSTYTRVYSISGYASANGTVSMDISVPSNATVTSATWDCPSSKSGDLTAYTNLTLQMSDYGDRYVSGNNIKNYINASHPSRIRFYWNIGYMSQNFTRTESTSYPALVTGAQSAVLNSFTPKMVITYTLPEDESTVSYGTSNVWQKCKIHVAADNTWKKVKAYFGTGGSWKQVK